MYIDRRSIIIIAVVIWYFNLCGGITQFCQRRGPFIDHRSIIIAVNHQVMSSPGRWNNSIGCVHDVKQDRYLWSINIISTTDIQSYQDIIAVMIVDLGSHHTPQMMVVIAPLHSSDLDMMVQMVSAIATSYCINYLFCAPHVFATIIWQLSIGNIIQKWSFCHDQLVIIIDNHCLVTTVW